MNSNSYYRTGEPSAWVRFPIMTKRPISLPSIYATSEPIRHDHNNSSICSKKRDRGLTRSSAVFYRRRTTINILPDDVLLEIFDFYQIESNIHVTSLRPGSYWLILVHVCQRWRHIVLVSPRRLDLTLFCTFGTPVRKNLGSLPPFPIVVDYLNFRSHAPASSPDYNDDIIAALEHPDRVRTIKLAVTSSLLEEAASVMQESFASLTTLWLSSRDRQVPVIPDVFLSGPTPHLLQIFLEGISFPSLPTLLSSASNLVDLQLKDIPQSGYISPEVMITCLAPLNRLDTLCICLKAPISRLQLRPSPVTTRHILPSLVTFNFHGSSEYLEHLLAQIDTPRLRSINIAYFNQLDFQVPQLSQFIRRTEHLQLSHSRHKQGRIRMSGPHVELDFAEEGRCRSRVTICISSKWLDWQVLHLAQILGQSPSLVSNVDHLSIDENDLQLEPGWKDSMDDTNWLELLRPFTAVKVLHGSKQLAGHIALALDSVGGELITGVLPALASLSLEDQPVRSVEKFLAARQLSGHIVTFIGPVNLLVDGFIARTFGSEDANIYLELMLRKPPVHFLQYYGVLHYQGAWYIMRNSHLVQGTSPGVPIQPTPLLDYSTRAIHGTVVPQRRSPTDEVDVRRHVGRDLLQLPIFFVNHNGRHGFLLSDILRGCDRDLRNANNPAQLGPRTTTSIRIGWPGYMPWKHQIATLDESIARLPITVGRFMKEVGISVDTLLQTGEHMSSDDVGLVDRRWKIGAGGITQDDVIVIGAIHVSAGSWMPILQLNRYVI